MMKNQNEIINDNMGLNKCFVAIILHEQTELIPSVPFVL